MNQPIFALRIFAAFFLPALGALAGFSEKELEKITAMTTQEKAAYFARLSPAEILAYEQLFTPVPLKEGKLAPITSLGNAQFAPAPEKGYDAKTLRQIADLALFPPVINSNPGPEFNFDQYDFALTDGIERTPKGRLWSAWMAGEDGPLSFVVAMSSDDNGETWTRHPRLVINGHSRNQPFARSNLAANFWADPQGRLWLFFDQGMHQTDGRAGVWASVCENPDAENPAWSKPQRICNGHLLNKPIVLSSGEWLLPTYLPERNRGNLPFSGIFPELDTERGSTVYASTDKGRTWERRGTANFPHPNWPETMLVERKDNSLWMLVRTNKGIMQSTSLDKGLTWSKPNDMEMVKHPAARFHIRRLASGRILLIKHGRTIDAFDDKVPRSQLTAWVSEDDGKTWKGGLMLDERPFVTYPDGTQAPDGTIYVQYDHQRYMGDILMARFTEEDILAGKLVNPNSRLQMLVHHSEPAESVRLATEAMIKKREAVKAAQEAAREAAAKEKAASRPAKTSSANTLASTNSVDGMGDWFLVENWDKGVPTAELRANVTGISKLTINGGAAEAKFLNIGSNPTMPARVALENGSLNVLKGFSVAQAQRGNGAFVMSGGTLNAGSTTFGGAEPPAPNCAFLNASVTFSGGVAELGDISFNLNNKLNSALIVEGGQASIRGVSFSSTEKESPFLAATLRFILGASSVSAVSLAGALDLGEGRFKLVVDGGAYRGGPGRIPLFKAGSISGKWAETSFAGFTDLDASIESGPDHQILLVLSPKP